PGVVDVRVGAPAGPPLPLGGGAIRHGMNVGDVVTSEPAESEVPRDLEVDAGAEVVSDAVVVERAGHVAIVAALTGDVGIEAVAQERKLGTTGDAEDAADVVRVAPFATRLATPFFGTEEAELWIRKQ